MPHAVTIRSLPVAFEVMKGMQAQGLEWGDGYRPLARAAVIDVLEGRMAETIEDHLAALAARGAADRRNGSYDRHLLTELGDIALAVPRTRTFSAHEVLHAYARRVDEVDRMILACFVLGLATRKVGKALLPVLGRPVSPSTVSTVAKRLDGAVAAFHDRPLKDHYKALMLDGVVLAPPRPAPAPSAAPSWSPSACATTAGKRSSTSAWRPPRAPPRGRPSSAI